MKNLTEQEFNKEMLQNELPILIEFSAKWCGPCKMLEPILNKLSTDLQDKVKIFKMDYDNCVNIAKQFNVTKIPTLILLKNGNKVAEHIGLATYNVINKFIRENI